MSKEQIKMCMKKNCANSSQGQNGTAKKGKKNIKKCINDVRNQSMNQLKELEG